MSASVPPPIVEHVSSLPFDATLERLEGAVSDAGMTIFAMIDHTANAAAVGLRMPPTTVLIYGKAAGGTPIMLAAPNAALNLPLHVLVREDPDGRAIVCFHPIASVLEAAGVAPAVAKRLEPAQALLLRALKA